MWIFYKMCARELQNINFLFLFPTTISGSKVVTENFDAYN